MNLDATMLTKIRADFLKAHKEQLVLDKSSLEDLNKYLSPVNQQVGRILYFHLLAEQHLEKYLLVVSHDFNNVIFSKQRFGQKLSFARQLKHDRLKDESLQNLDLINQLRNSLAHQTDHQTIIEKSRETFVIRATSKVKAFSETDALEYIVGYLVLGILVDISRKSLVASSKIQAIKNYGVEAERIELEILKILSELDDQKNLAEKNRD
ncbi:MAG: hypothetical protein EOP05_00790 [Proteobacteria bacterium]|nr:MAG: hypothetical protein EOP05_00790 [Pseudomonadota bacterium]